MRHIFTLFLIFSIQQTFANEKSVYEFSWLDKDKEVYVLQNRKFRKDGRVYISGNGTKTISGAFIDAYGVNLRGGFFFKEDWGVEFLYGKSSGTENDTAQGVKEQGTKPFYRKIDSYMGAMLQWAPFYSKINTFNQIFYYDWMFGLGAASVRTLDNRKLFEPVPDKTLTSENNTGLIWNTGLRFHITQNWSIRLDFTGFHFSAKKTSKPTGQTARESSAMFSSYDLGLGLNYSF